MLSRSGESWIGVLAPDDSTLFDLRIAELVGPEMAVRDDVLYVSLRRGTALLRTHLGEGRRLPKLSIQPGHGYQDRPGMIQTWMKCDAH